LEVFQNLSGQAGVLQAVVPQYGPFFKAGKRKEPGGGFPILDYSGDHGHSPELFNKPFDASLLQEV
jgi:hypothetical protein